MISLLSWYEGDVERTSRVGVDDDRHVVATSRQPDSESLPPTVTVAFVYELVDSGNDAAHDSNGRSQLIVHTQPRRAGNDRLARDLDDFCTQFVEQERHLGRTRLKGWTVVAGAVAITTRTCVLRPRTCLR